MKRWAIWLSIITAVALGGCATFDTAAIQSQTKGKRIVVSSLVNSKLSLAWVGTTAFNVEKQALEKPEWQLPDRFVQHLIRQLQASDRFSAVTLSMDTQADRNQILKTPASEADLVLILSNGSTVDPLYSTNHMLHGFGVYQRTAFGIKMHSLPHAVIKAELVDLQSGKTIAEHTTASFEIRDHALGEGAAINADKTDMVQQSLIQLTNMASTDIVKTFGFIP